VNSADKAARRLHETQRPRNAQPALRKPHSRPQRNERRNVLLLNRRADEQRNVRSASKLSCDPLLERITAEIP
jgi:hypothetical protein